ncbi:hypothetical protein HYD63_00835 [Mycoplasmopsis bovis]|nr:hypothetical protein [Mycoplasmopsis bovis]QQH60328.1 hypothetical protein HYD63_00835 [Mycoplasmopsis bovis]
MGDLDESLHFDIDSKKFPLKTNVQKLQEKQLLRSIFYLMVWKIKLSEYTWILGSKEKTVE